MIAEVMILDIANDQAPGSPSFGTFIRMALRISFYFLFLLDDDGMGGLYSTYVRAYAKYGIIILYYYVLQ